MPITDAKKGYKKFYCVLLLEISTDLSLTLTFSTLKQALEFYDKFHNARFAKVSSFPREVCVTNENVELYESYIKFTNFFIESVKF